MLLELKGRLDAEGVLSSHHVLEVGPHANDELGPVLRVARDAGPAGQAPIGLLLDHLGLLRRRWLEDRGALAHLHGAITCVEINFRVPLAVDATPAIT